MRIVVDTMTGGAEGLLDGLRHEAERQPLSVDISDYSDEWCEGFLAGQVNAIDAIRAVMLG